MIATEWYKGRTPNMHMTLCDRDHHLNLLHENFELQFPVAWGIGYIYLAALILISGSTTKAFCEKKKKKKVWKTLSFYLNMDHIPCDHNQSCDDYIKWQG